MFFESKRCQADGKYVFVSPQGLTSSIKTFKNPQSIQSMMVGENHNYTHHPLSTTQKCPAHYEHASYDTGDNGSTFDSSLSSNWYDALSDTSMSEEYDVLTKDQPIPPNWNDALADNADIAHTYASSSSKLASGS
ncbi:hypothetical protein ON010_g621 [Phytophthora cinnamomi]|nr:hypothetical protein ON010_g621 [Phytophthora cinnamomi]